MKVTVLGCGSSGGVPRIGNVWGACDPAEPKNRRRRCSILVEKTSANGVTRILVDTSPDLRMQLLDAGISALDAVVFTHEHADHTHGIDELRALALLGRARVKVWADQRTGEMLLGRFGYCFYTPPNSDYPPILDLNRLEAYEPVTITGAGGPVTLLPFELDHGNIQALGLRIGSFAYTPDLNGIPERSVAALTGLDLWLIDALRPTKHPSHFSLAEALEAVQRLGAKRAVLTNMHIDLDYATLQRTLPANVEPAYDGMELAIG
ncbi:MAG: MBL fold metallo-hydrolase [Hyphomicrobiales bacterium]